MCALRYFLFFRLFWAIQKICIVFHFSSTSIHVVCVNVPLRPEGQKCTQSVLPWRGRFWPGWEVRGIPLRDREQAHRVLFLVSCWDSKEVAWHSSPRNCFFLNPKVFQREFHNTQLQCRAGAVGARTVGISAQWVSFLSPKAAATRNCSAQTNWVWLAKKKQRSWHCRLGVPPSSASPRELTLQGESWARWGFSAILSLCPRPCSLLWRLLYWMVYSPPSCLLCSWGVHRIQYLCTCDYCCYLGCGYFVFSKLLIFHLHLLTFVSPYGWKVSGKN